jgi:dihydrofolate reductase
MQGEESSRDEVTASTDVVRGWWDNVGAIVMGRNMFGGGPGPWRETGAAGGVRTLRTTCPSSCSPTTPASHWRCRGTTFHFVTEGIAASLKLATEAADGKDVWLTGGASVIRQYLRAGLLDQIEISLAPVLLGAGERLFADLDGTEIELEQAGAIEAPSVTHITYRVKRNA